MDADDLVEQIERSFADLTGPGRGQVVREDPRGDLEAEQLVDAFAGVHWRDLTLSTLLTEGSALSFFRAEAFRFFLPAYLRVMVTNPAGAQPLAAAVVSHLTLPNAADALSQLAFVKDRPETFDGELGGVVRDVLATEVLRSDEMLHDFVARMAALSEAQAATIVAVLDYLNELRHDEFGPTVETAIYRYWFAFRGAALVS